MYRSFSIPRRTFYQLVRQADIADPLGALVLNGREKGAERARELTTILSSLLSESLEVSFS